MRYESSENPDLNILTLVEKGVFLNERNQQFRYDGDLIVLEETRIELESMLKKSLKDKIITPFEKIKIEDKIKFLDQARLSWLVNVSYVNESTIKNDLLNNSEIFIKLSKEEFDRRLEEFLKKNKEK